MAGNYVGGEHVNEGAVNSNSDLQRLQLLRAIKTQFYIHKSFDFQSDMEFLPAITNEFDGGLGGAKSSGYNGLNSPSNHLVNPYQQMNGQSMNFNDLMKASKNRGMHTGNGNEYGNGGVVTGNRITSGGLNANNGGNGNFAGPGGYRTLPPAQMMGTVRKKMGASPGQYYSGIGGGNHQQHGSQLQQGPQSHQLQQPQGHSLQGQVPTFSRGAQRF